MLKNSQIVPFSIDNELAFCRTSFSEEAGEFLLCFVLFSILPGRCLMEVKAFCSDIH